MRQLYYRLGWCLPESEDLRPRNAFNGTAATLPLDEVGRLAVLNSPDLALYAFAVRRAEALEDAIPLDFEPKRCSSR